MNTSPVPQPTPPIPVIKPTFYNVVVLHDFDYHTLQLIATMACVEEYTISAMFTTTAIHRADAAKILAAFSEYTQESYTFDNVRVAFHPTFSDIVETHQFDLAVLATGSGVAYAIVDMMLVGEPVPVKEARLVLHTASRLSGNSYTLDNVDVTVSAIADIPTPDGRASHAMPTGSKSEVARLMQQIEEEFESGTQALQGLAQGTARHAFINKRMENISGLHEQLRDLIGDEAMPLIVEKLDQLHEIQPKQIPLT